MRNDITRTRFLEYDSFAFSAIREHGTCTMDF
jgi:hypothetical protein